MDLRHSNLNNELAFSMHGNDHGESVSESNESYLCITFLFIVNNKGPCFGVFKKNVQSSKFKKYLFLNWANVLVSSLIKHQYCFFV